jgi:teichoic acid transport system ATP-binding protein
LGFAVAIAVEPEIMILDEILAVGDKAFQEKCLEHIAKFRQSGGTILFVSHNLGMIRKYCERVMWLERGKVKGYGDTEEVVNLYEKFMESPPPR